jgi:HK97 gp10 family phage protein
MARTKNISVTGLDDLTQQFKKLMATAEGPALQEAILEGARMIESEAERRAPIAPYATRQRGKTIPPGGLRKSIKAKAGRKYKNFLQAFTFTVTDIAPHAHLVEFGTKPHVIAKGKMRIAARAFAWLARVGDQVRAKVQHPGARPNPFFSGSIKAKRTQIKRLIESRAKAAFDALARAA